MSIEPNHQAGCEILETLQSESKKAADEFTKRSRKLRAAKGIPAKEFARLRNLEEQGRLKSESARRAVRNHMIEHGCG
jgi:hypothetical protein